ncbi:MAG: hypothetical protein HY518_01555 [Candidatus Aenigmarchaeota archaeon]|nr:hypothetical protein [Candidatus Aenigmarchaeota archaeon]
MKRENKIAFIQVKLVEGWKDIDIRKVIGVPKRTYFRWKSGIQTDYAALINKQKPGPKPRFCIDATNN